MVLKSNSGRPSGTGGWFESIRGKKNFSERVPRVNLDKIFVDPKNLIFALGGIGHFEVHQSGEKVSQTELSCGLITHQRLRMCFYAALEQVPCTGRVGKPFAGGLPYQCFSEASVKIRALQKHFALNAKL